MEWKTEDCKMTQNVLDRLNILFTPDREGTCRNTFHALFAIGEEETKWITNTVLEFLGNFWDYERGKKASAILYLCRNGERVGGGYHSYSLAPNGSVIGKMGARSEVVLDPHGNLNQNCVYGFDNHDAWPDH